MTAIITIPTYNIKRISWCAGAPWLQRNSTRRWSRYQCIFLSLELYWVISDYYHYHYHYHCEPAFCRFWFSFVVWECTSQTSLLSSEATHTAVACWIAAPRFFPLCRSSRKNLARVASRWFTNFGNENGCFFDFIAVIGSHHEISWKYGWNATANLKPPLDQVGTPCLQCWCGEEVNSRFWLRGSSRSYLHLICSQNLPFQRQTCIYPQVYTHIYIYIIIYIYMLTHWCIRGLRGITCSAGTFKAKCAKKRAQQGMTAVWWATNVGSRAGNRPAPAPV